MTSSPIGTPRGRLATPISNRTQCWSRRVALSRSSRTAVRNMMDAGIPQTHAMYISGHKTDSIFRRYDIVSDDRLAVASARMQSLFEQKLTDVAPAKSTKIDAKCDAKSRRSRRTQGTEATDFNGEPGGARTRDHRIKSASQGLRWSAKWLIFIEPPSANSSGIAASWVQRWVQWPRPKPLGDSLSERVPVVTQGSRRSVFGAGYWRPAKGAPG